MAGWARGASEDVGMRDGQLLQRRRDAYCTTLPSRRSTAPSPAASRSAVRGGLLPRLSPGARGTPGKIFFARANSLGLVVRGEIRGWSSFASSRDRDRPRVGQTARTNHVAERRRGWSGTLSATVGWRNSRRDTESVSRRRARPARGQNALVPRESSRVRRTAPISGRR